jgi:hypothetical protein
MQEPSGQTDKLCNRLATEFYKGRKTYSRNLGASKAGEQPALVLA